MGEYLYFSASKRNESCPFYRTKDPFNEPFEEIQGEISFWDPHLFRDDDERLYLYWGCSNLTPIYTVELDPNTLKPKEEPRELIDTDEKKYGFERNGEDHIPPKSKEEVETSVKLMLKRYENLSEKEIMEVSGLSIAQMEKIIRGYVGNRPYIEGAWMTKHQGKYYLQYSVPGTKYNVYGDAVYIGETPLGPFTIANNNPYSYKPGGFINGAGHGSTLKDIIDNYWHSSTMRICRNDNFERRIGMWKSGFDGDGELFCDQRYGDWPISVDSQPFDKPNWMLLSYGKKVNVSSGENSMTVVDEDIRTFWKAENNKQKEWIEVDLGKLMSVNAIQINFADDTERKMKLPKEAKVFRKNGFTRFLDQEVQFTRWKLEGSINGMDYFVISDKTNAYTDLAHDLVIYEEGLNYRYIRLTILEVPYGTEPCISGLRIFGKNDGDMPKPARNVTFERVSPLDVKVCWEQHSNIVGYNILWGHTSDKLYHSYMVFGKMEQNIGALTAGQKLFMRVDTFNETGITEGT
ncbi:discoidin domain-containing protein, partial [Enterococcus sp. 12F9_DIV0723]